MDRPVPAGPRARSRRDGDQSGRTPELAVALNDLGQAQYLLRAYADAERNCKEALAMDLEFFGEEHPEVAVVRENLAGVYVAMGGFGPTIPIAQPRPSTSPISS